MSAAHPEILQSTLDALSLFNLLCDFKPRPLKEICDLAAANNLGSASSVLRMLNTLVAANWLNRDADGCFAIHVQFTAVAIAWQRSITQRLETIRQEIDQISIPQPMTAPVSVSPAEPIEPVDTSTTPDMDTLLAVFSAVQRVPQYKLKAFLATSLSHESESHE